MKLTFYYDSNSTFTATGVVEWRYDKHNIYYSKKLKDQDRTAFVTYWIPSHDVRGVKVKDGDVTSVTKLKKNCTVVAGIIK